MSMLSRPSLFNKAANEHINTAGKLLWKSYVTAQSPYYNPRYHASSFLYPFWHLLKAGVSLGRIAKGALFFVGSFFCSPLKAAPNSFSG